MSLFNLLVILVILQSVGSIFKKQIAVHALLNTPEPGKKVKPHQRHGARIKAAETGSLISGAGMLAPLRKRIANGRWLLN